MATWIDVGVRETSSGGHYLLQMKVRSNGKKVFRNRRIDGIKLFHGNQGIEAAILEPKS